MSIAPPEIPNFRGPNILYTLLLKDGAQVQVLVPSTCSHAIGEKIGIKPQMQHMVLFPRA